MTAVVAAIDFGTHGTGYAWTDVTEGADGRLRPVRQQPIFRERWPGADRFYPKDLSAVLLGPAGEIAAWGHEAKREWARLSMEGAAGYGYVSGFKMALKADAYQGLAAPGVGSIRIDSVSKARPLVVAYLRRMRQLALAEISSSGYPEREIRWCLTVPAIWDEAEKQLMRDAAAEAGLPSGRDRLLLTLEPEAAAVYCQAHLARVVGASSRGQRQTVGPGARFMVVDCGGGTVDITAFQVSASAYGDERMVEIGKVSGGKFGSEYINEKFIATVLHDRLDGADTVDRIRRECPHALLELVERWESEKVTATARPGPDGPVIERPVYVPVPGEIRDLLPQAAIERLAAQPGGSRHRIVVTPQEVRELFDASVDYIVEEVSQQLADMRRSEGPGDRPPRILLVGGLSGSDYLQQRIRSFLDANSCQDVALLVPANPAAAVLFGAVLYGCNPPVIEARRVRYTFGCQVWAPFEDGVDEPRRRVPDGAGPALCKDRFSVFVTVGDLVKADQRVVKVRRPVTLDQAELIVDFYRTREEKPRYVDDPGCELVGTLTVPLGAALSLPLADRGVEVAFRFGDTEISASAVNLHTQEQVETVLRFGQVG